MKLKFISPPKKEIIYLVGVHSKGYLCFNKHAAAKFNISVKKSIMLLIDELTKSSVFYGKIADADNDMGYKILSTNGYHLVKSTYFFNTIGLMYSQKNSNIKFIATEVEIEGELGIKFTPLL